MTWDGARHRQVSVESFHGRDGALVRGLDGIPYYALLADLENLAETTPSPEPGRASAHGVAQKTPHPFPRPAKRFDRWKAPDGSEWIFDQPRNPDGSYASDDEGTEIVESRLDWYEPQGDEVKAEHRPAPGGEPPTLEIEVADD